MSTARRAAVARLGWGVVAILIGLALAGIFRLRVEEARIRSIGVTLAASLVIPRWESPPYPAIVVVHGSGRVTRNRLLNDARALASRGVAALAYDKRGVGESSGTFRPMAVADSTLRIHELADDVAAAVDYLAGRKDVDSTRIGLLGGSEAGWVMPLAASRTDHVSFMIVLSGPAVSSGEEALFSQLTGDGTGPSTASSDAEIDRLLAIFAGPHGYDPGPVLQAHRVPTLWMLGGRDRSIPPRQTEAVLRGIAAAGSRAIDVRVFPTADHDLRDAATGVPVPYWTLVTQWLQQRGVLR